MGSMEFIKAPVPCHTINLAFYGLEYYLNGKKRLFRESYCQVIVSGMTMTHVGLNCSKQFSGRPWTLPTRVIIMLSSIRYAKYTAYFSYFRNMLPR